MAHFALEPEMSLPVPSTGSEAHRWVARRSPDVSNREISRQQGTYRSAIPADLSSWTPEIPAALAADLDEATQALMDFDSYAARRLGAENSAIGPMSAILLRTESASSSEIEQLTSSPKQLALADLEERSGPNARTILGNVRALEAAIGLSQNLSEESILSMHRVLMEHQPRMEEYAGRYRDQVVWIGAGQAGPVLAHFVPPQHDLVPAAMEDLLQFVQRLDLPVLLQVAVAHAQFETIHPFVDGNGRTGRALAQAMLRSRGLTRQITAPVSAGLLTDPERYFDALAAFREGEAGAISDRFLRSALFAASTGKVLVDQLAEQLEIAAEKLSGVRSNSKVWTVLPQVLAHPVLNARFLQQRLGLSGPGAQRVLAQMTERGVLKEGSGKGRNRIWQHDGILTILEDYAQRVRRHRWSGN